MTPRAAAVEGVIGVTEIPVAIGIPHSLRCYVSLWLSRQMCRRDDGPSGF